MEQIPVEVKLGDVLVAQALSADVDMEASRAVNLATSTEEQARDSCSLV
jgi:hypothetical protein